MPPGCWLWQPPDAGPMRANGKVPAWVAWAGDENQSFPLCAQLVAGLNYFLDVEIGRTTCTKSQPNLANCPFHEQPNLKKVCT